MDQITLIFIEYLYSIESQIIIYPFIIILSFLMEKTTKIVYLLMLGSVLAFFIFFITELLQNDHQISFYVSMTAKIFLIQILAYIPAFIFNTQKFYDLTGSLTYLFATATATFSNPNITHTQIVAALMVSIWALRLGSFLFLRVIRQKGDKRFDQIKKNKVRFFFTWLLQGLWVSITISPLLTVMTSRETSINAELAFLEYLGGFLWIIGFVVEAVSDSQKTRFREDVNNKYTFIRSGLWKYSRHPNYVGEFVIWIGAAIFAIPSLSGSQLISLGSPLFVYLLIAKVSGVPMLQKKANDRWSQLPEYQQYKRKTPVLFPWGGQEESKTAKTA